MLTGLSYLQLFGYYLNRTYRKFEYKADEMEHAGQMGDVVAFDVFAKVARAEWDTLYRTFHMRVIKTLVQGRQELADWIKAQEQAAA